MYDDKKIENWNNWYFILNISTIHWHNALSSFSIKIYKEY